MKKSVTLSSVRILLSGIVVYGVLLATPVHAARSLTNLTTTGASVAAGNAACPNPYFLYVGGLPDNFTGGADPAYPSADLLTHITNLVPSLSIVDYDFPGINVRFGESFNLQNTRSVCYAVIKFKAKYASGTQTNDSLTIGHVETGGSTFTQIAQVIDPGAAPILQTYAFTAAGLTALSELTGVFLDKTPLDSVLDIYLQDDTKIDFIQLWVWYGPNCSEVNPATC